MLKESVVPKTRGVMSLPLPKVGQGISDMRDEGGASGGGGTLPTPNGGNAGASPSHAAAHSVVPADQLLDVAAALSEGATRLHAQLRHLSPADQDAVLDVMADQLTTIVTLFTSLVRGVVTADASQEPRSNEPARAEDAATIPTAGTEPKLAVVGRERPIPERVPVVADAQSPDSADAPDAPAPSESTGRDAASAPEPTVHINPYRRPAAGRG